MSLPYTFNSKVGEPKIDSVLQEMWQQLAGAINSVPDLAFKPPIINQIVSNTAGGKNGIFHELSFDAAGGFLTDGDAFSVVNSIIAAETLNIGTGFISVGGTTVIDNDRDGTFRELTFDAAGGFLSDGDAFSVNNSIVAVETVNIGTGFLSIGGTTVIDNARAAQNLIQITFDNVTAPGTPAAAHTSVYVKSSDKKLYYKDDAGLETGPLGGGGGSHVIADTTGLGPDHTTSGLTAGQVLRATAATTAAFQSLVAGDIPGLDANKIISGTIVTARLPVASASAAGIVSNGTQEFNGNKTFDDNLTVQKQLFITGASQFSGTLSMSGGAVIATNRDITGGIISGTGQLNSGVGYRIGNAAASGKYIRGNGTNGVFATILAGDLPVAASGVAGIVSTGTQTFSGDKTITGFLNVQGGYKSNGTVGVSGTFATSVTTINGCVTGGVA